MTKILSNNFNRNKIFKNKKVVLCHGVFDLLHLGHINYFKSAKKFGQILVVSITSDQFVNKGPGRPVFNLKQRLQFLSEISCIDYICVSDEETAIKVINKVRPNFYCKGPDYSYKQIKKDLNLKKEISATEKNSGKFVSIKEQSFSSSKLINSNEMQDLDEDCKKFIGVMNKKYGLQKIIKEIKKIEKLKVLIIGETIIDKYIFTETVGKSGKEPILIFKKINETKFLGGIGYIANLISSFAKNIKIASFLGDSKNEINFIKQKLNKKINHTFFIKKNSPTINKLRYVDEYRKSKIFGVYDINDSFISENEEKKFIKYLRREIKKHDVIIVADYGHGMMTKNIRNEIFKYKEKIFLNTQINSFNRGFHTLFHYKKINTLVINESELRYELRDKNSNVDKLSKVLKQKIKLRNLIITKGKYGANYYSKNKKNKVYCPAFGKKPVDAIGAGDALFAISSLALGAGVKPDISTLIGSLAASYSIDQVGHEKYFNYKTLLKYLKHMIS
tara:strand:- start:155 stop:1666 length:1512 start_codon:yes stop_codon:yes gene_type:complete